MTITVQIILILLENFRITRLHHLQKSKISEKEFSGYDIKLHQIEGLGVEGAELTFGCNYLLWSMYLPNPSTTVRMHQRSILKQSTAGLNSEFSFSLAGLNLPRLENPDFPTYLYIVGRKTDGFMPFSMGISLKCNANSFVQDLNSVRRFHFLR